MKLEHLKLNRILLEKKSMKRLKGGYSGTYKCGCVCVE